MLTIIPKQENDLSYSINNAVTIREMAPGTTGMTERATTTLFPVSSGMQINTSFMQDTVLKN